MECKVVVRELTSEFRKLNRFLQFKILDFLDDQSLRSLKFCSLNCYRVVESHQKRVQWQKSPHSNDEDSPVSWVNGSANIKGVDFINVLPSDCVEYLYSFLDIPDVQRMLFLNRNYRKHTLRYLRKTEEITDNIRRSTLNVHSRSEIISIFLGGTGSNIGSSFFELLYQEHKLTEEGIATDLSSQYISRLPVYCNEIRTNKYRARAIFVDTDSGPTDSIRSSKYSRIFSEDNYIVGRPGVTGTSHMWYAAQEQSAFLIEFLMDSVRKELENCDSFQAFQFIQNIGGGIGGALGSEIMMRICDEYVYYTRASLTIYPSLKSSQHPIEESFNTTMGQADIVEYTDVCFWMEAESLVRKGNNSFQGAAALAAKAFSTITAPFRFPSTSYQDLRKFGTNLVPFSWLHFFGVSLTDSCDFKQLFMDGTQLHEVNTKDIPQFFTGAIHYRGNVTGCPEEVLKDILTYDRRQQPHFMDWLQDSIITNYVSTSLDPSNSCLLANNSAIRNVVNRFDAVATQFYKSGKLDLNGDKELDFFEAQSKISDFRDQYVYTPFYDSEDEDETVEQ